MASNQAERLLIVDDEEYNRDMLERRLKRHGFEVWQAASGPEAVALLDRQKVDLVLLDVMMPGQSGIDVLKELRGKFTASDLPVVMVTACDQTEEVVEALRVGANDYLTKPVNFPVMLARLATQLQALRATRALQESQERFMLAARGSNDGLWDWDLMSNQVFYASRWKQILGFEDHEVTTSPEEWFSRVHPEDLEAVKSDLQQHWAGAAASFESEHRLRHKSGNYRWVLCRGAAVRDAAGKLYRVAGSLTDLTASKVSDPLTGLPNRLLFHEKLETCLAKAKSTPGYSFALLFIDVDRFKVINDSLGHAMGDQLLLSVAHRLRDAVRESDTVVRAHSVAARFGGDEFAILLDNIAATADAQRVAARMLEQFAEPYRLNGQEVFASISIGIAVGNGEYASIGDLLRDADTAMYRAKALGKARAELFDRTMHDAVLARLQIESDLRRAVERDQFSLFYQPIHSLSPQGLVGFEALIRWRHPVRGLVPPNLFIPIAEETGVIISIGDWVLREACRQIKAWQIEFPASPPIAVGVNVSGKQLRRPEFVGEVRQAIESNGLEPKSLRLEITETALVEDADTVSQTLIALKALGVGLQIDDFGTGYCSFSYVDRFPVDTVKIDRSFVCDLPHNHEHAGIVQAVMTMAKSLGMAVTAEGVETQEQLDHLRSVQCELAQGYLFSKPLPSEDAVRLLHDARAADLATAA